MLVVTLLAALILHRYRTGRWSGKQQQQQLIKWCRGLVSCGLGSQSRQDTQQVRLKLHTQSALLKSLKGERHSNWAVNPTKNPKMAHRQAPDRLKVATTTTMSCKIVPAPPHGLPSPPSVIPVQPQRRLPTAVSQSEFRYSNDHLPESSRAGEADLATQLHSHVSLACRSTQPSLGWVVRQMNKLSPPPAALPASAPAGQAAAEAAAGPPPQNGSLPRSSRSCSTTGTTQTPCSS